jgi:hypothetical protein
VNDGGRDGGPREEGTPGAFPAGPKGIQVGDNNVQVNYYGDALLTGAGSNPTQAHVGRPIGEWDPVKGPWHRASHADGLFTDPEFHLTPELLHAIRTDASE